jgi:hypothetical protein
VTITENTFRALIHVGTDLHELDLQIWLLIKDQNKEKFHIMYKCVGYKEKNKHMGEYRGK